MKFWLPSLFAIFGITSASADDLASVPFKEIQVWKANEIKEMRISDYAIFWGESNPPLPMLIAGSGKVEQNTNSLFDAIVGVQRPAPSPPPPFPITRSRMRSSRLVEKSCTSNMVYADSAQYQSHPICTTQVADRDYLKKEAYVTTGTVGNTEIGRSADGITFIAVYSPDGKLRHMTNIFNFMR